MDILTIISPRHLIGLEKQIGNFFSLLKILLRKKLKYDLI